MRKSLGLSALFAFFAIAPACAQGTAQQREACSNDAFRFCDRYVPDAIAVEHCLRAHMGSLSSACRAEFGVGGAPAAKGRKGKKPRRRH